MNTTQVILHRVLITVTTQVFRHVQGSSKILFSRSAFTNYFWENFFRSLLEVLTATKQGTAACCTRLKNMNGKVFPFIAAVSNNELNKWDTENNKRLQQT